MAGWESDEEFEASLLEIDDEPAKRNANQTINSSSSIIVTPLPKLQPCQSSTPLCSYDSNKPLRQRLSIDNLKNVRFFDTDDEASKESMKCSSNEILKENINDKRKRKFPGPAGVLPKLSRNVDMKLLKDAFIPNDVSTDIAKEPVASQGGVHITCITSNMAWRKVVSDLELSQDHLKIHSIQNALTNASMKTLPDRKVPLLVTVVESINKVFPDATVMLRDLTGSMQGVIHRFIVKQYNDELKIGSVLLLKNVAVFSPSPRRQYLNITPNNLLQIYSLSETEILCTEVNQLGGPLQTLLNQPVTCPAPKPAVVKQPLPKLLSSAGGNPGVLEKIICSANDGRNKLDDKLKNCDSYSTNYSTKIATFSDSNTSDKLKCVNNTSKPASETFSSMATSSAKNFGTAAAKFQRSGVASMHNLNKLNVERAPEEPTPSRLTNQLRQIGDSERTVINSSQNIFDDDPFSDDDDLEAF